jgi:hypothetical protein
MKCRIASSVGGKTPVVNTGASAVGKRNGAPRMDHVCSRLLSSAIAAATRSCVMPCTLACRDSSAAPGGLF